MPKKTPELFSYSILRCQDNSLYTGITTDIERRFHEHQERNKKGAHYTHAHPVDAIVAYWICESRSHASQLEYWLKTLTKVKKEKVVVDNEYLSCCLGKKIDVLLYQRGKMDDLCYDKKKRGDERHDN